MNIIRNRKLLACLIGLMLLIKGSMSLAQQPDYRSLESSIQAVVKKVSAATVAVCAYDTSRNRVNGLTFSAVVVSSDGYILTAAHAASPHQIYQVAFPDGKKVLATGLGHNSSTDAAIIKIIPAGNWPYAEMGSSNHLQPYQPCISMGYPQNMQQSGHPLVRFGHIVVDDTYPGFFCNTALMEPGDSGGPLFDIHGKVIGIHSRISQSMDANFEVPVHAFQNDWDKMIIPKIYMVPDTNTLIKATAVPGQTTTNAIPALENMPQIFSATFSKIDPASYNVFSRSKGEEVTALGTLITVPNRNPGNKSYIISKSSIVGDDSIFVSYQEKSYAAKAIARNDLKDLVLLEVSASLRNGIDILSRSFDEKMYNDAGKFLLSPGTNYGSNRVSILSSPTVGLIPAGWKSFIGFTVIEKNNAILIDQIDPHGPSNSSKLKKGDEIKSIDGIKVNSKEEFEWMIASTRPSTNVRLKGKRKIFGFTRNITLKQKPFSQPTPLHLAEQFEAGKSVRKDGFKKAFIHDARLYPSECGGPVFDGEGNFMGINIARVCRTSSIAIPASDVKAFLQEVLK